MEQTILTADQQRIWNCLLDNREISTEFYLTGGTALAQFYFQHRLSEDFDLFSEKPLVETDIFSWVKETSNKLQIEEVEYKTLRGQLIFFFHFRTSVVKVEFAYYPFSHLGDFTKHRTMRIASLLDIGVNKLQAIQTRKRGRDFFDLYFILTKGKLTIPELLKQYRNKFDIILSPEEAAKHLAGVLDAQDQPKFLGTIQWSEVEQFILKEAREL
jgi:predicted nucleotidyltransferase component of viral defense system